jgi:prevent-host-death family protein
MTRTWKLEDAKAHLSQLIRDAELEPQVITRHGKPVALVTPVDSASLAPVQRSRSAWEALGGAMDFSAPEGENWDNDWLERDRRTEVRDIEL